MLLFRLILIAMIVIILVYTGLVGVVHGWDLLNVFFHDIAAMKWPGQFNVDFSGFLLLSALWTMWRNNFSPLGFALGIVAFFGGIMFLAPYLLILSFKTGGDMREILLGRERTEA